MKIQFLADDGSVLRERAISNREKIGLLHVEPGVAAIWQKILRQLERRSKQGIEALYEQALEKVEDGTISVQAGDKKGQMIATWVGHVDYADAEARGTEEDEEDEEA